MNQGLVAEGRVVKANWKDPDINDLPVLQGLPFEKAEKKLDAIRKGGDLTEAYPLFPNKRKCQDCFWIVLFVATGLATLGFGWSNSGKLWETWKEKTNSVGTSSDEKWAVPTFTSVAAMIIAALGTAMVSSVGFIMLARRAPSCVVWTSLIFGPVMCIVTGVAMAVAGASAGNFILGLCGLALVLLGGCSLTCVLCCWKDLIPFMIQLTEVVADVIEEHPCCIGVGLIGAVMAFLWVVLMGVSFASLMYAYPQVQVRKSTAQYVFIFVAALIFVWGGGVATNICHMTYCGVFGRWYFGGQDANTDDSGSDVSAHHPNLGKGTPNTLAPSFGAAVTTSLGSICCGSFLVAFVRALEAVARKFQGDAQQDGNWIGCIVACIIRCFIECIGDFLEYFNEWAYVQCAIRGVSFMQAANITYSMITCANLQYILSDLLLGSLVSCGTMMAAFFCTIVTAGVGFAMGGAASAGYGAAIGFLIGALAGSSALGVINSGIKTILACWAEDDAPLRATHPEIHQKFSEKIIHAFGQI